MPYFQHIPHLAQAVKDTFDIQQTFKILESKPTQTIWIVASGSSYSQAVYFSQLISNHLHRAVVIENPYSFVRHCSPVTGDICIHITQEAKRLDNYCPIEFATSRGMRTILFTSKETELSKKVDEVYWFAPEKSKLLVACMSYISPYMSILQWVNAQLAAQNLPMIDIPIQKILDKITENTTKEFEFIRTMSTFLYTGYAQSVAIEAALKVNECLLLDSESYELKHFSHGKHFVSWNQPRVFNVVCHSRDLDLVQLYQQSIFESHHTVNMFVSDFEPEIAVFDWASQMLVYISQAMKISSIDLEHIPIRDKIRLPHGFGY